MREETTTRTLYQYDELSDRAKEAAREWYREASSSDFSDFGAKTVLDDASRIGALIGININTRPVRLMNGSTRQEPNVYWSVGDRGAGASYAGYYRHRTGGLGELRREAPANFTVQGETKHSDSNAELHRIADALADVQHRNFYQVQASIEHRRDLNIDVTVERADDKPMSDADVDTVVDCLRDFATWIHSQLESEWKYQNSDETIEDNIRANEYEFTEDGRRA